MELREEQAAVAAMGFTEELRWRKNEKAIPLSSMGKIAFEAFGPLKWRIHDSIITVVVGRFKPGSVDDRSFFL
uniref:Uncharacterized protein n=1 Tax=Cucumis melo TaxID=3656 RepID=A0A9I9DBM0_CUCME